MSLLILSHTDLDGLGIVCLADYYKDIIKYDDLCMANYGDFEEGRHSYELLKQFDTIWYFDFSPDLKSRQIIEENNIKCICGDHHEAVKEDLMNWSYDKFSYIYKEDQCGTKIFFEFLKKEFNIQYSTSIEEFSELVNTYDLWQKDSVLWTKAQNLNRLLYKSLEYYKDGFAKYKFFIECIKHKFDFLDNFEFNKLEMKKINDDIKKEDDLFFDIINNAGSKIKTRKDELGRHFSVIKLNSKISAIANRLLEKYKKLDYVIAINCFDKNKPGVSLRSKEHVNLLEYENVKGHENAAGYENVTQEIIDNLWDGSYIIPIRKEL